MWHHGPVKKVARAAAAKKSKAKPKVTAKAAKGTNVARAKTKAPRSRPNARYMTPRADLGAPIDNFFVRQPPHLRPILDELRRMVEAAAPAASSTIKWGMPFFTIGENMVCALAGFKAHVNLILPGPPGTYADPNNWLEGDGKTGKHLKLRSLDELPRATVQEWLRTATARAQGFDQ